MRKKLIICLFAALNLCALLSGCGDNGGGVTAPATTNSTATKDTTNSTNSTQNSEYDATTDDLDEEEPTLPNVDRLTLSEYKAMTAEQQNAIVESFATIDDFFAWYKKETEEYQKYIEKQQNNTKPIDNNQTSQSTDSDISVPDPDEVSLMEYNAMSGKEQMAFANSFETPADFIEWHTAAKKAYDDSLIEIDGTEPIDANDIVGKN